MRQLFLVLIVVSLLAGCSAVRVGYNQLDWIIPVWFQSFVPLTETQKIRLRTHTREMLAWHCETQLPRYAIWLRQVNTDFQAGITRKQLVLHSRGLEQAWIDLAVHLIPRVADIFSSLTDEQVGVILEKMGKDNTEYRREYMTLSDVDLRNDIAKQVGRSFRRWFGRLNETQKQTIEVWSQNIELMSAERWSNRMRWQSKFREVLKQRRDTKRLIAGFRELAIDWDRNHTPAYQRDFNRNNDLIINLVLDLGRMMTVSQKRHMAKKTTRYAADFDYLTCSSKVHVAVFDNLYREWSTFTLLQKMMM